MVVVVVVVVSHIQRIGCQPEKLLYTVANPARGLLNREKRTKEKVWQHTPPSSRTGLYLSMFRITSFTGYSCYVMLSPVVMARCGILYSLR